MITPECIASLVYEMFHNDIIIESDHTSLTSHERRHSPLETGMQAVLPYRRRIRYAQDEKLSLALSDDDLLSLSDINTRKAFFTVKIIDQKQSLVDLVLRAYSACPGLDFFEYTEDELIFPQIKNVKMV